MENGAREFSLNDLIEINNELIRKKKVTPKNNTGTWKNNEKLEKIANNSKK